MLAPKRVKHRKTHKGKMRGKATEEIEFPSGNMASRPRKRPGSPTARSRRLVLP